MEGLILSLMTSSTRYSTKPTMPKSWLGILLLISLGAASEENC